MQKLEEIKNEQIKNILLGVKIAALLFCSIICFKYISLGYLAINDEVIEVLAGKSGVAMLVGVVFLIGVYLIWVVVAVKKLGVRSEKHVQHMENIIFLVLFLIMIMISGKHQSPNKFLFLFIITTTTIQSGLKYGLSIAGLSSILILTIDLVCGVNIPVNPYFEDDLVLVGIFMLIAYTLGHYVKMEKKQIADLQDMVNRDGLTGVYNHRYFYETLGKEINIA